MKYAPTISDLRLLTSDLQMPREPRHKTPRLSRPVLLAGLQRSSAPLVKQGGQDGAYSRQRQNKCGKRALFHGLPPRTAVDFPHFSALRLMQTAGNAFNAFDYTIFILKKQRPAGKCRAGRSPACQKPTPSAPPVKIFALAVACAAGIW